MITLILLGLLGSALPAVSGWFWGLYIASWVYEILKLLAEIGLMIYAIKTK